MPSPLKERRTGRLGRLLAALRPSRAGPLPVQTGFPTSLADLVVKNHGRLKKPSSSAAAASSRRRKHGASPLPSPPPSPSPPPQPSPPPPPPAAAVVSPPAQREPEPAPVGAVRRSTNGGLFGLGLGFLALGGVVSLALLVIWSRKVVAAVTVASFSLFVLESLRSSALRRRPRPAVPTKLDLAGRGYVSPIREVEAEAPEPRMPSFSDSTRRSEPSFSGSSRRSEPSFSGSLRRTDPTFSGSLRRSDPSFSASSARRSEASILAIEERCEISDDSFVAIEEGSDVGDGDGSTNPKAKAKRSWKKLISSKLHKGRKSKEAGKSGSFRVEGNAKATDSSDSRHGKSNRQAGDPGAGSFDSTSGSRRGIGNGMDAIEVDDIARAIELDAPTDLTEEGDGGGRHRFPFLVVVAVVLVGLVAGTLPAVAFTVLCSSFLSSVQRLPDDGGDRRQRGRRLELAIM